MKRSSIRHLLHAALFMVVLSCAGHIHNHVCLDGQEVAATVHFENLGGHPDDHQDDATHEDVETELTPTVLLTKTLDQDTPLFLTAVALLVTEVRPLQRPLYVATDERIVYHQPSDLLPPSQAPPAYFI
jgi:hypothetical protein